MNCALSKQIKDHLCCSCAERVYIHNGGEVEDVHNKRPSRFAVDKPQPLNGKRQWGQELLGTEQGSFRPC